MTMARKSRIDAPGALHHIIIRGIERRSICTDARDYQNFIERLGSILSDEIKSQSRRRAAVRNRALNQHRRNRANGIQWRRCRQKTEYNTKRSQQTCFASPQLPGYKRRNQRCA